MRTVGIATVFVLLGTTAQGQDKSTIERLNETFATAFTRGDMAAVAGMYSEDAYLLPPGEEIVKGRAAIQSFWTKAAEGIADFKLTTVDVKPIGSDAAREVGSFLLKTRGQ